LGVMLLLLLRSSGNQQIKIFGGRRCVERGANLESTKNKGAKRVQVLEKGRRGPPQQPRGRSYKRQGAS
jgi:hypothetical protein